MSSPSKSPRRLVAIGLALLVALSGCGSDIGTEPSAGADTLESLERLDAPTRNLVEFEAAWQCDLTRFAFDDLSEIDDLRVERQQAAEITPEAYTTFIERLDTEGELAQLVAQLSSNCTSGGEGDTSGPVAL